MCLRREFPLNYQYQNKKKSLSSLDPTNGALQWDIISWFGLKKIWKWPWYIKFSNKAWHCFNCSKNLFPFTQLITLSCILVSNKNCSKSNSNKSCFALKPPKKLSQLFNKFNSKYYDINQQQTFKESTDKSSPFLFHLDKFSHIDLSLPNYGYEFYLMQANAGDILISYIYLYTYILSHSGQLL